LLKLGLNLQVRRRARRLVGMGEEEEGGEGVVLGLERRHGGRVYTVYPDDEVEVAGLGEAHPLVYSRRERKWVAEDGSPTNSQSHGVWFEDQYPCMKIKSMVEKLKVDFGAAAAAAPPPLDVVEGTRVVERQKNTRATFLIGMVREMFNRDGNGRLRTRAGLTLRKPEVGGGSLIVYGNLERRNQIWVDPDSAYGEEACRFGSLAEVVCCFEFSPAAGGINGSPLHLLVVRTTTLASTAASRESSPLVCVETAPEYTEAGEVDADMLYAYRLIPLWSVTSGALCFPSSHRSEASVEGPEGGGIPLTHQGRLLWVMPPHLCNSIRPSAIGSHFPPSDEEDDDSDDGDEVAEAQAARVLLREEEAVEGLIALIGRAPMFHV